MFAVHGHMNCQLDFQQGPLFATAGAMQAWKWEVNTSTTWKHHEGVEMDLTVGSPALLVKYMVVSHE